MPAKKNDIDINRVALITRTNVAMMTTMHDALFEITKCDVSFDGSLKQKEIAQNALVAVYQTAQTLEVKNA